MQHIMTIPASIDALFLQNLAGIRDPWGYGPAADPAFQTLQFEPDQLDDVRAALVGYDEAWLAKEAAVLVSRVNQDRDQRIASGFAFEHEGESYTIQSDQSDRENVIGLAVAAMGAISQGAQPGDLHWLGTEDPFGFIAADNRIILLDAYGMMALYRRGLAFKMGTTLYARALKNALLAATDLTQLGAVDIEDGWPA